MIVDRDRACDRDDIDTIHFSVTTSMNPSINYCLYCLYFVLQTAICKMCLCRSLQRFQPLIFSPVQATFPLLSFSATE